MVNFCLSVISQHQRTNDEVFMPVSLQNVLDLHPVPGGQIKINLGIPPRVNHRCCTAGAKKIGVLCQAFRLNSLKNQLGPLPAEAAISLNLYHDFIAIDGNGKNGKRPFAGPYLVYCH